MNISKFTQKSMEAVNQCEKLAFDYGHQEIEQEHLLYTLLTIEDSLIKKLIEKMEIDAGRIADLQRACFIIAELRDKRQRLRMPDRGISVIPIYMTGFC